MHNLDPNTFKVSKFRWTKRNFDAASITDLKEYNFFLKNSKWRINCPFELEWPFLSIPEMIQSKLIEQYLDVMLSKAVDEKN